MIPILLFFVIFILFYILFINNNNNREHFVESQRRHFSGPAFNAFNSSNFNDNKEVYNTLEPTNLMLVSSHNNKYINNQLKYTNNDFFDDNNIKSLLLFGSIKNVLSDVKSLLNNNNIIEFKFNDVQQIVDQNNYDKYINIFNPLIIQTISSINHVSIDTFNISIDDIKKLKVYINKNNSKLIEIEILINVKHPYDNYYMESGLKLKLNANYIIDNSNIFIKDLYINK